jgi:hypothetical protein
VARRASSALVARRIAEIIAADPGRCIVVCGDFNESPDEFERAGGKYPTAFMPGPRGYSYPPAPGSGEIPEEWLDGAIRVSGRPSEASLGGEGTVLYSPWYGNEGFSYIFGGEEERLDGFLLGPALLDGKGPEFIRFMVSGDPSLLDENGCPAAWNGFSGFSDHLPIALTIAKGGGG